MELCLHGTLFDHHCIGGVSRPLAALMTMCQPSLNFLSLYMSLKVEEVAPVLIRTIGYAGFLTVALKFHLMQAS